MGDSTSVNNIGPLAMLFGFGIFVLVIFGVVSQQIKASTNGISCASGYTLNQSVTGNPQCNFAANLSQPDTSPLYSAAYNISGNSQTGITNLSNQSGLIGTILGLAVVLGILTLIFVRNTGGGIQVR